MNCDRSTKVMRIYQTKVIKYYNNDFRLPSYLCSKIHDTPMVTFSTINKQYCMLSVVDIFVVSEREKFNVP
jgi:hypothetical protein